MRFQLSIRGALIAITVIAFYCAILGLAYNGDIWGSGISVSVTLCLLIWLFSAVVYWGIMGLLALTGIHEANQAHSIAAKQGGETSQGGHDPSGNADRSPSQAIEIATGVAPDSVSDLLSEEEPS